MSNVRNKLYALVQKGESSEVEFKSARGGFPGSFWESYSAFANTNGGTIILGVQEKGKKFLLDGLSEDIAYKYKKNFWDCAHNRNKVSVCLPRESDVNVVEVDGAYAACLLHSTRGLQYASCSSSYSQSAWKYLPQKRRRRLSLY